MTDQPAPLTSTFVLSLRVDVAAPVKIGPSDLGERQYIPITGGAFEGFGPAEGLVGKVLPGGADWQLSRADGVTEVEAHYAIETEAGAVIVVRNCGLIDRTGERPYVRTAPRFQAPEGRLGWLNRSLFVGTIRVASDFSHVVISVFRID